MAPWERLNPHLLRHFLAVSRTGSLTAAAQQLHCVPSVSYTHLTLPTKRIV